MGNLLSVLIILAVLFVMHLQIDAYRSIITQKFRNRYFALRDRLAMLVCSGELDEQSWEYRYVIDALNYHINVVERLSILDVVEALVNFHTSDDEDAAISRMQKTVDHEAVKDILDEYMLVTHQMLRRNSRWQMRVIRWGSLMRSGSRGSASTDGIRSTVTNPAPALSRIDRHRSALYASDGAIYA